MIGIGEKISISTQPWLKEDDNPYITSESQTLARNNVAFLICVDRRDWDKDIIRDLFNERDQQCILSYSHISNSGGSSLLVK